MSEADETPDALIKGYDTYDRHADVVAVFEWIFTNPHVDKLPDTVEHFERFPRIKGQDGGTYTPDFTVLFKDDTAIIGEIAKIALHPHSIDKLCAQLLNYASLNRIPSGVNGSTTAAKHVDVLYLVDNYTGNTAYRGITGRIADLEHPYAPPQPPCIVQFARQAETGYTFQRHLGPANGTLVAGSRETHIGTYLDGDFHPPTAKWIPTKVSRPFINDPVQKLYLATRLTMQTWNEMYGPGESNIEVIPSDVASHLRSHYGVGRVPEVKAALRLLDRAGRAALSADGKSWIVSRSRLSKRGEKDVHRILAGLLTGNTRRAVPRARRAEEPPLEDGMLF